MNTPQLNTPYEVLLADLPGRVVCLCDSCSGEILAMSGSLNGLLRSQGTNAAGRLGELLELLGVQDAYALATSCTDWSLEVAADDRPALLFNITCTQLRELDQQVMVFERLDCEAAAKDYTDPLTGLPLRTSLECQFAHWQSQPDSYPGCCGLLFIDVDRFKQVNDRWGHLVGDEVLRKVAYRILGVVREQDLVVRFGGDEFVVLMKHLSAETDVYAVVDRLQQRIAQPLKCGEVEMRLSASIGQAVTFSASEPLEVLLERADEQMYRTKNAR